MSKNIVWIDKKKKSLGMGWCGTCIRCLYQSSMGVLLRSINASRYRQERTLCYPHLWWSTSGTHTWKKHIRSLAYQNAKPSSLIQLRNDTPLTRLAIEPVALAPNQTCSFHLVSHTNLSSTHKPKDLA